MIIRILFLAIFLLLHAHISYSAELFPMPEVIRKNVDFWTRVYSQYTVDQVVLHDRDQLDIVYEIITIDKEDDQRWNKVRSVKSHYNDVLRELCRKSTPIDSSELTLEQRYVFNLWSHLDDPNKFKRAAYNIRAQTGLRERFKEGLIKSGLYMNKIKEILQEYGIPLELSYLPHVESSFNVKAYSRMGAAGMWQFTRSTGRLFLDIGYSIDERFDPILATEAAAKLLRNNYLELNTWPLAITAYNHGANGMKRAVKILGTDEYSEIFENYQSRSFGFASKNFYSEFLAAKTIAQNYQRYFGELELAEPLDVETFELPDYVTLSALSKELRVDKEELASLNPAFRTSILKDQRRIPKGYRVRLPNRAGIQNSKLYTQLSVSEKFSSQVKDQYYKVKLGDNLSHVAARFGTSLDVLMDLNDLSDPNHIRQGQMLELPTDQTFEKTVKISTHQQEIPGGGVEPADNTKNALASSITSLLDNNLKQTSKNETHRSYDDWQFQVDFEAPDFDRIIVQPEETLGHYADWLGISTYQLRKLNNIPFSSDIHAGQKIRLGFNHVRSKDFHRKRLEFHRGIQERFFQNYKIQGFQAYTIQKGDNVWRLAQDEFNIPWWLLKYYNNKKDLYNLYPGETIQVPVVKSVKEFDSIVTIDE